MKDRLRRWLTPVVIDRTRRGTHDRGDVTEPCRGGATAVSCRAASRTSRRACPCPVLLRTLHIGGASLKSRATSTRQCYRGRPRTSQRPRVSRHAGYARSIATSCKRKPFGGCSLDQIAAIAMVARARATGGGFPEVIQQLPAAHMHPGWIAQRTRRLQAEQPARISRQVAGRCLESRKRLWTRAQLPSECAGFDARVCAHGRTVPVRDLCQLEAAWARLVRDARLAPVRSLDRQVERGG